MSLTMTRIQHRHRMWWAACLLLLLLLPVALFLSPQHLNAEPVKLGWDANDPAEGVEGYKLYWGNASGDYCCWLDVGAVTESGVIDIPLDSYIAVTAYNETGESDYSTEIFFTSIESACCGSIVYEWIEPDKKKKPKPGKDYQMSIGPDGSIIFTLPQTEEGDIWEF